MKSINFLLPLLGIFILSQNIQAQMVAREGFKEGYKAIQFGIGDNFRLTTFDGSSLSLMKYTSENTAQFLRFSYSTTYQSSNAETTKETNPDEIENFVTDSQSNDNQDLDITLRLNVGAQKYLTTESDVLPFITRSVFLGTSINSDTRNTERTTIYPDDSLVRNTESETLVFRPFLGLSVGVGADFFIAKNISLTAQTGIDLLYQYSHSNQDTSQDREDNGEYMLLEKRNTKNSYHTVSLQPTGVLFGLSAYF